MIRKHILNGLTLSLMLSLIPTPAHAGWFSWMGDYFNKPTKNALAVTIAVAGASLLTAFACAWSWWKNSKAIAQKDATIQAYKKVEIADNKLIGILENEVIADNKLAIADKKLIDKLEAEIDSLKQTNAKMKNKLKARMCNKIRAGKASSLEKRVTARLTPNSPRTAHNRYQAASFADAHAPLSQYHATTAASAQSQQTPQSPSMFGSGILTNPANPN